MLPIALDSNAWKSTMFLVINDQATYGRAQPQLHCYTCVRTWCHEISTMHPRYVFA